MTAVETVKTIADLDLRSDLDLITNSQEVEELRAYLGSKEADEMSGFFVKVQDGDYSEIWGFYGCIPYIHKTVYKFR